MQRVETRRIASKQMHRRLAHRNDAPRAAVIAALLQGISSRPRR
jgi:hypothetical protein